MRCTAHGGFLQTTRLLHIGSLAVLIGAVALRSLAGETIEGAFGKKLGDVFDPNSSIRTAKAADGTPEGAPIYEFSPTTRFGSFDRYYVRITPTTHRICSLEAVRDVDDKGAAQTEQVAIMQQLKEKYGVKKEIRNPNGLGELRWFRQNRRSVATELTGLVHVTLSLRYGDDDVWRAAATEKDAATEALSRSRGESFTSKLQAIIDRATNVLSATLTNNTGNVDLKTDETPLRTREYFRANGITNLPGDLRVGMRVEDTVAMLGEPTGRCQIQNGEIVQGKPEGQYEDWLSWRHNERGKHVAPYISVRIEGGIVKALKAGLN